MGHLRLFTHLLKVGHLLNVISAGDWLDGAFH
jgi:hypothetical protein